LAEKRFAQGMIAGIADLIDGLQVASTVDMR
jgi:hypothetical protein